ncbi:CaiB/BaiF CoA-transferase family protein [Nereida sp. MMG025]|uniref:CaiB/BaiF CoA transferase family protein n=1 Tax=Nereida sp. MMG025 TaxID=2909981 RepID=UPI001F243267|nr:CoA transferase [Nereida sp. MMG025]MCF6445839.1 CoA transferase [Nereida sp. MMG025]
MSLHGIRVIDLTRVISGPFCTQQLADLGADVIKVESPKGDPLRAQGTMIEGMSSYFASFNRNKRSIALDPRDAGDMQIIRSLIKTADVLVDNFKPGTMDKMGLSDAALQDLNPRLIACHISGFGQTGPYAQRPAFDFVAQAMSGFMFTNGFEDGPPLRSGLPISDLVAGLYATIGITAALATPKLDRKFNAIDVAMTDSMISLLSYMATETFATGHSLPRVGNDHPLVAPYGLFDTRDGHIAVAVSHDGIVERLFSILGCSALLDDPRFATNAARIEHRDAIKSEVQARFNDRTTHEWTEVLNNGGVPAGPVLSVEAALNDPQTQHRNMTVQATNPMGGWMSVLGCPIKQTHDGPSVRTGAPLLDGDREAILSLITTN